VEQPGTIRVVRDGRELGAPFLDLRRRISRGDERGLLSMAFAPDYASSGLFYVYFTDGRGDIRVEEYRRSPASADVALPSTRRLVLRQRNPDVRHNGGEMEFGPDVMLYLGLGTAVRRATPSVGGRACTPCSARSSASTPATAISSRRAIPSCIAAAPARRSGPTACGTRGASRSPPRGAS
jgi:glucose/arabinose dehydrogenase